MGLPPLGSFYGTERFLRAGGCSRSGNKKRAARRRNAAKQPFPRTQSRRAFPIPGLFSKPPDAKRRTQYFLLSDLPHRWIYFDYDQGPLSCVHLPFFANYMAAAPAPRAGIGHILFYYSAAKKWGQP